MISHLKYLSLNQEAIEWLLMLWDAMQFIDDVEDGADFDKEALPIAAWNMLVAMPVNKFFIAHADKLVPVMASAVMKWKASNDAERRGAADEKSFVWRAGYYEVVLMVVLLHHGAEKAMRLSEGVLRLYGENFDDYLKEFYMEEQNA